MMTKLPLACLHLPTHFLSPPSPLSLSLSSRLFILQLISSLQLIPNTFRSKKEGKSESSKRDTELIGEEGKVILKVDMDCNCIGCADKLKTAAEGFDGVQDVKAESSNNKLTVEGKVHPEKIREWIKHIVDETKKKVFLVSPRRMVKEEELDFVPPLPQKKADDKKPKEPVVSTVVFKIGLNCMGCIRKIERIISETKGVKHVAVDLQKGLVTLKGNMNAKTFSENLKERAPEIVQPKKDDGGGDKKGRGGGGGGGGGEKKCCKLVKITAVIY